MMDFELFDVLAAYIILNFNLFCSAAFPLSDTY